jgi:hypothetical protein
MTIGTVETIRTVENMGPRKISRTRDPGQQRTKRLMRPGHLRKMTHVLRSRGEDKNVDIIL